MTVDAAHDFAALARRASRRHGFTSRAELTAVGLTENPTFKVYEPGVAGPIVVRIYRPGGRPLGEVRSELAWMSAARAEANIPAPAVIETPDGDAVLDVAEDGAPPVFAAAFALAPGREAADDDLPWLLPQLAELTARLHLHARSWPVPSWFQRPRWDVDTTLGDQPHWGRWQVAVTDPEQRRQLEALSDLVVRRLRRFGTGPERFGLVHADLRSANVLVDDGALTVIDFEDCGFSWYLYDLAATLTFNEARPDVGDLIASWVTAYRRVAPLSSEDEAEIETFLMLRRLLVSAWAGSRSDTSLARELESAGYNGETCTLAERYLHAFG